MSDKHSTIARLELREHQTECCAGIDRSLSTCGSTLVVSATGTGKSLMIAETIRRRHVPGTTALVIAHRREIIGALRDRIAAQCPDLVVVVEMAEQRGGTSAQSMLDGTGRPDVIVASVQTLCQPRRLARFDVGRVRSVVVDEAHHAPAESYRRIIAAMPQAAIIGFTATADRADGVGLRTVFEAVAFRLELREAIERGLLVPIRVEQIVSEAFDVSNVRMRGGDLDDGELAIVMGRDSTLHAIAAPVAARVGKLRGIVFVPGRQTAHDLAEVFAAYGVVARAVDCQTDPAVRAETISAYVRGDVQVMINDSIFLEGFDAPSTGFVVLAKPTKSRANIAQQVGRVTRLFPGKELGLVIDCVSSLSTHCLASPVDILGSELSPREREAAQRALADGADLVGAERRARETVAEEDLREALRQQDVLRAQRSRVTVDVTALVRLIDPFARKHADLGLGEDDDGPRATAEALADLRRFGVDLDEASAAQVQMLISKLRARARRGICTLKQSRTLYKFGCSPDASFRDANSMITALAGNRWRRPRDWEKRSDGYFWAPQMAVAPC